MTTAASTKPVRMYKIGGYAGSPTGQRNNRSGPYQGDYEQPSYYSNRRLNAFEDPYENRRNNNRNYRSYPPANRSRNRYRNEAFDEDDEDDYYNRGGRSNYQRRRPRLRLNERYDNYYDDDDEYDEYDDYDDDEDSPYQEVRYKDKICVIILASKTRLILST